jgi:ABC-2 type transport system ATP-binding protein
MADQNLDFMIEAEQLTKVYGSFTAIKDITFRCRPGEIVGFLGPNGAGKTTTMRILTGYMPPTSGTAYIGGHDTISDSIAARQHLGYLPETVPLYPEMTVEGFLAYVARIRRLEGVWERVDDVLEAVDLLDRAESYIGALSKGMRQRVGLAQALIHNPAVLILDEPTIGLDPRQVVELRALIKELGQSHTILLSTHILSEVEQICDRVITVIDGRIWADMPLADIIAGEGEHFLSLHLAGADNTTTAQLETIPGVLGVQEGENGRYTLSFTGRDETRTTVAETVVNQAWGLLELTVDKVSLESVFLSKLKEAEEARVDIYLQAAEEESEFDESPAAEKTAEQELETAEQHLPDTAEEAGESSTVHDSPSDTKE